jgi:chromosome segregation ATPase
MENLVITINGVEFVRKTEDQDLLNKIKQLESEIADLEDELGRAMSKFQDLEDELCSVQADRDEYENALHNILRIANQAV